MCHIAAAWPMGSALHGASEGGCLGRILKDTAAAKLIIGTLNQRFHLKCAGKMP
jgi:hypothetical protein